MLEIIDYHKLWIELRQDFKHSMEMAHPQLADEMDEREAEALRESLNAPNVEQQKFLQMQKQLINMLNKLGKEDFPPENSN